MKAARTGPGTDQARAIRHAIRHTLTPA
jgi:hypothetical protein